MMDLPLRVRLRRATLIALLLGLWAPFKVAWEQGIARQQDALRYQGVTMTRHLRDQLGQGLTIGVLSGMRGVVADLLWINVTLDWEQEQWFDMEAYINLCTALQPRSLTFWDMGGWQLSWNASVSAMRDRRISSDLRRLRASQFWIEKGLEVYKRGIENNPEHYKLWADTGLLYQQRLAEQEMQRGQKVAAAADYHQAAYYYAEALKRRDVPVFYERFPAYMLERAGDDQAAYDYWRALWFRLTPEDKAKPEHAADKVQSSLRKLEDKLSIPKEKRVFPN